MMTNAKTKYLTIVLLLLFPPLLLGLLAAGSSQYDLLSSVGGMEGELLPLLASFATIFEIILLVLLFLLGVLLLLAIRPYSYRFLCRLSGIVVSMTFLLSLLALVSLALFGFVGAGNVVCFVFFFLFLAGYWTADILFVELPAKNLLDDGKKRKDEKRRAIRKRIERLREEGRIDSETASSLLSELDGKDETE